MERNRVRAESYPNSQIPKEEGSSMTSLKASRKRIGQALALVVVSLTFLAGSMDASQSQSGSPPSIVKIDFPTDVSGRAQGKVHFRDSDGDLIEARFGIVDGGLVGDRFKVVPDVAGATEGNFPFEVRCGLGSAPQTLKLTLFDRAGNRSTPAIFTFNCGVVPASNSYDEEQATVRPINTRVVLNFFILEDDVTELAEGATFTEPTAMLGEPSEIALRAIQEVSLPDLTGIWDQCGIGFELGAVAVVRLRNVSLRSGGTLESIFSQGENGKVVTNGSQALERLEQAIPILNETLKTQGREITKDDRNMFLVGLRIGQAFVGVAQIPGRVTIVRWDSIWVDPTSGEIFKPKRLIRSMAHELGHNLGLPHSSLTLMDYQAFVPADAALTLTPEQCRIVEHNISLPPF
jgi:hypothetical protein